MAKSVKKIVTALVLLFAGIGVLFSAVFAGEQLGLFTVRGSIASRNAFFTKPPQPTNSTTSLQSVIFCRINALAKSHPKEAETFFEAYSQTRDAALLEQMFTLSLKHKTDILLSRTYEKCSGISYEAEPTFSSLFPWEQQEEWLTIKAAFPKDVSTIMRVSEETGIPARLLVATAMPEQMRFFSATRDIFKRYFEPLKILGTLSQFSLGVTGIKPETAKAVEAHASDPSSPFYPGNGYASLIAYSSDELAKIDPLYLRLTDEKDHYYQYLYTALYLKECMAEWQRAGFDISKNPGVLITLFNLGFEKSKPNPFPEVGGAPIELSSGTYTFGELGEEFYYSGELADVFPYERSR